MARKRPWTSRSDVDQYILDLEDVYECRVEMELQPKASIEGVKLAQVTLKAYWKDEPEDTSPFAYHTAEVHTAPTERYISNMVRALTDLTYQCVETYISRMERRN